jgi:quinone-modifying oxidoreductase subunit QmoC
MLLKGGWWGILFSAIKEILAHSRFFKCGINKNRALPHLLVLFSFIGLFIVTSLEFFGEQLLHIMELPLSLGHPIKLLANLSGIALLIGIGLVFNNRLKDKETPSTYWDWSLIGVILTVGVTGFLVEIFRLLNVALFAYAFYLLHLSFVFALFIYLPYSKFAHLAYRTLAIVNEKYSTKA